MTFRRTQQVSPLRSASLAVAAWFLAFQRSAAWTNCRGEVGMIQKQVSSCDQCVSSQFRTRKSFRSLTMTASETMSSSTSRTTEVSPKPEPFADWQVGNVYDDLDRLEQAISLSNADQHLRQVQDRERLDTFASQRRVVDRDVCKLILAPLAASFLLTMSHHSFSMTRFLTRGISVCNNLQFWVVMVAAPILMLASKLRSLHAQEPLPPELQGLDPDYFRFVVTDWEDPRTSCRDHVLCLLEQWTSAVAGAAVTGVFSYIALWRWTDLRLLPGTLGYLAQCLTRLGVIAALHQYPKLLYQLKRYHQPRPMDRHTLRLRTLVSWVLVSAPLSIAIDATQVLTRLQPIYSMNLGIWTGATALKYWLFGKQRRRKNPGPFGARQAALESASRLTLSGAQLLSIVSVAFLGFQRILQLPHGRLPISRAATVLQGLCFAFYTFAPLYHLLAVRKLFRFSYTHNISLANDYATIAAILSNPNEVEERLQHRYRLEWREPERLSKTLSNWKSGFLYWVLFEGGVEDQLWKQFASNQKGEAHKRGLSVLQRFQEDVENSPDESRPNSLEWKKNAMNKLATKHQEDYDSGTFADPLGVAVQQTFGIGLGYNFDHTSELKPGETPTTRRLQARAAKSAIRRAQKIYDTDAAQRQLDSIADPAERERRKIEMRVAADTEIAYLAKRLSELIPTDASMDPQRQTQVKQFIRRDYKRTSNHEMLVGPPADESSSLDSLLGRGNADSKRDEEFIEAWMKRQAQGDEDDLLV